MPTATVEDVRASISTDLGDEEILDSLNTAERWVNNNTNTGSQTTSQTKELEIWRAAINIKQFKERSVSEDSVADSSFVYEGDEIEQAKSQLADALNAAGENPLLASQILRDSNRYVTST